MHIYQFLEISCFQFMKFIYENKRKSEMLTKVSLLYVLEKLNVFLMIFLKCTFSSHFLVWFHLATNFKYRTKRSVN
jgi:hypothetical protein